MKKILIFVCFFCSHLSLQAQNDSLSIREIFKQMPDSLLPYLTQNNKLDLMDFMDAKMKAAVDNLLGGESEMTFLSDDSLCIKMSESMSMELKVLRDEKEPIIMMKRTYHIKERQKEILIGRYSSSWRSISDPSSVDSTLLKRDEEILEKTYF